MLVTNNTLQLWFRCSAMLLLREVVKLTIIPKSLIENRLFRIRRRCRCDCSCSCWWTNHTCDWWVTRLIWMCIRVLMEMMRVIILRCLLLLLFDLVIELCLPILSERRVMTMQDIKVRATFESLLGNVISYSSSCNNWIIHRKRTVDWIV